MPHLGLELERLGVSPGTREQPAERGVGVGRDGCSGTRANLGYVSLAVSTHLMVRASMANAYQTADPARAADRATDIKPPCSVVIINPGV